MKITKEYIEHKLKNNKTFTVYSPENIPFTVRTEPHITRDAGSRMCFEMDCKDLADYCNLIGLSLKSEKTN